MKLKRILSILLAAATLVGMLILPTAAAGFTDISDPAAAEAAEALRVMGVVNGTGGSRFNPSGTLTRAEFSKMAVLCMGLENEVAAYETRTIFSDVKNHWAKGYVNLAASRKTGEGATDRLIAGVGDGTFRPDRTITYGEAATILLRVLGYTAEANRSWPHGAVATAKAIGLSDALPDLAAGNTISRGQAAILFRNMLLCETKGGAVYISTIADATEDTILLSVKSEGVTTTASENTIKPANDLPSTLLVGRRGVTVLEKKTGKFLTFLPDRSTRTTITVASNATGKAITAVGGTTYSVAGTVPVWNGTEQKAYSSAFSAITAGKTVTLYFDEGGSVTYVYLGGGMSGNAMVAKNKVTGNPFLSLTGGAANPSIYKNGIPATVADIRQYDVAVYDSASNSLRVSDLRMTGIIENASPNLQTASTVTVMGHTFTVLDCAINDLAKFSVGGNVTLLLTENNEVAGAVEPGIARGTAVGLFDASAGTVTLLDSGLVLKSSSFSSDTVSRLDGQLVNVASSQKGKLSLSPISGSNAGGNLNISAGTVGNLALAVNAKVYDRVGTGLLTQINLSDLAQATIPASQIDFIHRNYAGKIDILVLQDVTGDGYTYGKATVTETLDTSEGVNSLVTTVSLRNAGQGESVSNCICLYDLPDNTMVGVALRPNGSIASARQLERIQKVGRANFDTAEMVFSTNSMTLPISDEVQCYLKSADEWLNADGLSRALGFSETFTVYYDRAPEQGGKVRIIVAE